jgi:hypothetical protein
MFQRSTFFQPSPLDDSAARSAQGLAQAFGTVTNVAGALGQEASRMRIASENAHVAAAASDIEVQIDFAKKMFPDDVEKFTNHINTTSMGTIKAMPEKLRGRALGAIDKTFQTTLNDIVVGENEKQMDELIVANGENLQVISTQGRNLARDLNEVGYQEQRQLLINSMDNDLYDDAERSERLSTFDKGIRKEIVIGNALKIADDPEQGILESFETLQTIEEDGVDGFDPDELSVAVGEAREILNTRVSLINKQDNAAVTNTNAWQKVNAEKLLLRATGSEGEANDIVLMDAREAFANREITFKQFDAIRTEIGFDDDGIDNQGTITDIKKDILMGGTENEINFLIHKARAEGDITSETQSELYQLNFTRKGLQDSPLVIQSKQSLKYLETSLSHLKGSEFGGRNPDSLLLFASAVAEYQERLLTADEDETTPRIIADDIIKRFSTDQLSSESLPNPVYGSKSDIVQAETLLFDAYQRGDIKDSVFQRESALLEHLQNIQQQESIMGLNP